MNRMYTKYPVRSPNHDRGSMNATEAPGSVVGGGRRLCRALCEYQRDIQGYAIVTVCRKTGAYTGLTGRGAPSVNPKDKPNYNFI